MLSLMLSYVSWFQKFMSLELLQNQTFCGSLGPSFLLSSSHRDGQQQWQKLHHRFAYESPMCGCVTWPSPPNDLNVRCIQCGCGWSCGMHARASLRRRNRNSSTKALPHPRHGSGCRSQAHQAERSNNLGLSRKRDDVSNTHEMETSTLSGREEAWKDNLDKNVKGQEIQCIENFRGL